MILCYHTVDPAWDSALAVSPSAFDAHCRWLARHRQVLSLEQAIQRIRPSGHLPPGATAVTFDDGFAGVFEHAFSILMRWRMPATVFVVAGTLTEPGKPIDWVLGPAPQELATLSPAQVIEMRHAGIAFGSHSYEHLDLTSLSDEECERDLRASREVLEEVLREPIHCLAYPRGRQDERVRRAARRAGFTHAFTLPETRESVHSLAIPRVGVYGGNGRAALRIKTQRWYPLLRTSRIYSFLRTGRNQLRASA
jgi:peptidoglycan/xylan/chitin deacetylase (PgdA/CDA1 family)